jgi:hypothetical protein
MMSPDLSGVSNVQIRARICLRLRVDVVETTSRCSCFQLIGCGPQVDTTT